MELNFESAIVTHCAPTLAGIKTANLFQFRHAPIAAVRREVRHWDEKLSRQGIRVKILKRCRAFDSCLIYVYRPGQLQRIISSPNTRAFLKGLGYIDENPTLILAQLSRRLCMSVEFPHEIGVFLGYPLDDVIGFIKNGSEIIPSPVIGKPMAIQNRLRPISTCAGGVQNRIAGIMNKAFHCCI